MLAVFAALALPFLNPAPGAANIQQAYDAAKAETRDKHEDDDEPPEAGATRFARGVFDAGVEVRDVEHEGFLCRR